MSDMTPEQMMEAQKANCIFCKIVKGEIPSKKIFEDEQMLAILDINPATKGHILVMPKEHYPILPLVPPETFRHLFKTTQQLISAERKAMIVPRVTMMIANGGAAGQQSPHFLYHLIPREGGDGLDFLDASDTKEAQPDIPVKIQQSVEGIMKAYLAREAQAGNEYAKTLLAPMMQQAQAAQPAPVQPAQASPVPAQPPAPSPQAAVPPTPGQAPQAAPSSPEPAPVDGVSPAEIKAQLAQVIDQNPALRELIIKDPQQVIDYVQQSPELSVLFEGVDIIALSKAFRAQTADTLDAANSSPAVPEQAPPVQSAPAQTPPAPAASQPAASQPAQSAPAQPPVQPATPEPMHIVESAPPEPSTPIPSPVEVRHGPQDEGEEVPDAATLSDEKLLEYLEIKPKLKEILLSDPSSLNAMIPSNPRLSKFFKTLTPDQVAERLAKMGNAHNAETKDEEEGVDFDALSQYLGGGQ